jgi:hypothetical protein
LRLISGNKCLRLIVKRWDSFLMNMRIIHQV